MKRKGMVKRTIAMLCTLNLLAGSMLQYGGMDNSVNRVYASEEDEPEEDGILEAQDEPEVISENAAAVLSKEQLEKFYKYDEDKNDPDGVKISLTDDFRNALNTSGGSFTAGDYTWKEGDPVPDPGVEYVTADKTYKITDISRLFENLDKLKILDMSAWDSSLERPYRNMSGMFRECPFLTELKHFSLNTPECTTMASMFYGCSSLKECTAGLTTGSVTSMAGMFRYCSKLETIPYLPYCDTSSLENMNYMFSNCSSLKLLNLENFGIGKVREMFGAFNGCSSLKKLNLSSFDFSWINPASGSSSVGTSDLFLRERRNVLQVYVRDEEAISVITDAEYDTEYDADTMELIVFDLNALDDDFLESVYEYKPLDDGTYQLVLRQSLKDILDWNTSVTTQLFTIKAGTPLPNPDSVNSKYHGKISSYANLFDGLKNAEVIDISLFDGKNIKDMSRMFALCSKLRTLKMRALQPQSGVKMDEMFYKTGCGIYISGSGRRQHENDAEAWVHDADVIELIKDPEKKTYWEEDKIKLKVRWKVILDKCGKGNELIQEINIADGSKIGEWTDSYSGYRLVGWYRDKEYTQPFDTVTTPIHSDITLYAKWEYDLSLTEGELEAFYDYSSNGDGLSIKLNEEFKAVLNTEEGTYSVKREDNSGYYVWHTGDPLPNPGLTHRVGGNELPVTSYYALFLYCNARILDLSTWETGNVTNMSKMFERCYYIKKLDVSSFDTSNVTNMNDMFVYFAGTFGFGALDLGHFDVSNVTDMEDMFEFAKIRSLNIDSWNTPLVRDMSGMFWCLGTDEIYMRKLEIPEGCDYENFFHNNASAADTEVYVYLKNAKMRNLFLNRTDEYGKAKLHFVVDEDPEEFSDSVLEKFYVYDTYEVKYYKVSLTNEFKQQLDKADGEMVMPGGIYVWHAGDPLPNPAPESSIKYREKVRSYAGMFEGSTVQDLNLSMFNTNDITNYREMFKNCSNIKKLVLGDFRIDADDDTEDMLLGTCASNTGTPVTGSVDDAAVAGILNDVDKTGIDTAKLSFKNQYIVHFTAGGGSGEMSDVIVEPGNTVVLPECGFTPPENVLFDKWDKGKPGDEITPDGSCIVKALWRCVHVAVHTEAKDPDCTTKGNIEYWRCKRCGLLFDDEDCTHEIRPEDTKIEELGHDWSDWETVIEADSEHDGLEERVCRRHESHKEQRVVSGYGPKTDISEAVISLTPADSFIYDGGTHTVELKLAGLVLDTDYTVDAGSVFTAKEIGTYTISISGKGSYKGNTTITWKIGKNIEEEDYTKPEAITGLVYNTEAQVLVKAGASEKGRMVYTLGDKDLPGGQYSEELPVATDAGTWWVWYKIIGDGEYINSTAEVVSVSIAKAVPELENVPADVCRLTYTGKEQPMLSQAITAPAGCVVKYSLDGKTYSTEIPKVKECGEYILYYKVEGTSNYEDIEAGKIKVEVTRSISALDPVPADPAAATELYLVAGQKFSMPTGSGSWTLTDKKQKKFLTVSKTGAVKAKKLTESPVIITNGKHSISVNICKPTIDKQSSTKKLEAGRTGVVILKGCDSHLPVYWYSAKPDVVTVDQKGNVTAVSKGSSKISAYVNGKAYSCTVSVRETGVAKKRTLHMNVGDKKTLNVKGVRAWISDKPEIAATDKKKIKANSYGEAVLSADAGSDAKTTDYRVELTVEDIGLKAVSAAGPLKKGKGADKYTLELTVGQKLPLEFVYVKQPLLFNSSKPDIVFADEYGLIEARSAGKGRITTKINGRTVTVNVTIKAP